MTKQTLRSKINRLSLMVIATVGVLAIAGVWIQERVKTRLYRENIIETLSRSASAQLDLLIPTFILPEQKQGQALVLAQIQASESLQGAMILTDSSQLPMPYVGCTLKSVSSYCWSPDLNSIAVVVPIAESGQTFGWLFKTKLIEKSLMADDSLKIIGFITAVLLITFFVLFLGIRRITAREVPEALEELADWIEAMLSEKVLSGAPNLKFKELNDLGEKIGEILDRHDKVRDQAVIGQLISGIMHDIKTPLHSVVTAIHLVEEQPVDSPKRLSRLENLFRVSSIKIPVIGNIIETVLDGSREIHVEKELTDLAETIRSSVALNFDLALLRRVSLEFLEPSGSVLVTHDPVQIARVLSNLIKNGIEAAGTLRSISDASTESKVRVLIEESNDGCVRIVVEDSGPGVSGNTEKVFRVFRSSKIRGTGLGLLISRKIVEAHQGSISVGRSERLGGARFEVTMPETALHMVYSDAAENMT